MILTIGLEPITPKGADFESAVSTISPSEPELLPDVDLVLILELLIFDEQF